MRKAILLLFTVLSFFVIKAQKPDTTIYQTCRIANDPTAVNSNGEEIIFDSCPQFKNGLNGLYKFISTHIHYPAIAKYNHIQGRVIVAIVIEKDGSISHAKVERGVSKDIDKEAVRVINSLPKWKPGILHEKPVRVKYYVVVGFKLPPNQTKPKISNSKTNVKTKQS